ncbi:signal peptidase I [Patescibacteria group bacterium]|nr:signal peptidase I [Patescibacteria group bacterium]
MSGEPTPQESKQPKAKKSFAREAIDLARFVLIILAIVVPIRVFIAQPFIVNGESMVPTFENGDYLIIDEVTYRTTEPERGDVIVFRNPTKTSQFLIKRIIGLPGETVRINGDVVTIEHNGQEITLDEEYTNGAFSSYGSWDLGEGEYFAMGDNRARSLDSRSWGTLPGELIVGKTLLRIFPITHLAWKPGEVEAEEIETFNNR